jgi:ABC-2 type transport system ATP-binding protein
MDNAIYLEDVHKSYGPVKALDGIDLTVRRGVFYGFLGPNGAGKSTTIKLMIGILIPDRGRILINGHDARREIVKVKASVGFLPEQLNLYERLTGREYLNFIGHMHGLRDKEVKDRMVELIKVVDVDTDKLIEKYSLGMKKKIALAAAMIHRPKLLLLDEPFTGIDVISTHRIREVLMQSTREEGVTIFFSSHVLEVIEKLCSEVAIIHHGKIIKHGDLNLLKREVGREGTTLEDLFLSLVQNGTPDGVDPEILQETTSEACRDE